MLRNISSFYGANAWHYYITQALPFDTMAMLPFILHGFYLTYSSEVPVCLRTARNVCLWAMATLSLISHKEFRFIQPLLPILHVLAAHSLVQLNSQNKANRLTFLPSIRASHARWLVLFNVPAILLFNLVHMRGQVSVSRYLSQLPDTEIKSVGFLMPCHSTPWQSHIHREELEVAGVPSGYGGRLWALTCEPPTR